MSTQPTERSLAAFPLFAGLGSAKLRLIDRLGTSLDLERGRTLCRESTVGEEFFVVRQGVAEVSVADVVVGLIASGGWLGQESLLTGAPHRATVRALTRLSVIVYSAREFGDLRRMSPLIDARLRSTDDAARDHTALPGASFIAAQRRSHDVLGDRQSAE